MSIPNFSPEAQAAIAMLYGGSDPAAAAAEEASPIAQAVAAAAQQLQEAHEGELESKRLAAAMQLVLGNGVTLNLDGSSSVHSGTRVYSQHEDACSCPDHQNRESFCKHLMAVELYRLAQALLHSEPAGEAPAMPPVPEPPASAAWDVHEAPVSCYLKLRVGHLELSYTMRDIDDEQLSARLVQVLPKVNAMAEAEAARREQLAAAQAEAKQAAKQAAGPSEAAQLQQMVQQAVQQALGQGNGKQAAKEAGGKPKGNRQQRQPKYEGQTDAEGNMYCEGHDVWMPLRSNDNGSWHSHQLDHGDWCRGIHSDDDIPF